MQTTLPHLNPGALDSDYASVEQIIRDYLDENVFTLTIVKIHSINENNQFINVLPVLMNETTNNEALPITDNDIIYNIPVMMMFGGNSQISFSLNVGDVGILIAAKNDISNYKNTKTTSLIASYRSFNFSDGIFLPFDFRAVGSGITLKNNNTTVLINENGVQITGETISINGNVEIDGNVTTTGDVVADGISLKEHIHGGVTPGQGTTSTPQ